MVFEVSGVDKDVDTENMASSSKGILAQMPDI